MRIISWNCAMAARKKISRVLELQPDLLILQECSRADIAAAGAKFSYWIGRNSNKGLGVLGFGDHDFVVDDSFRDDLTWFIPLRVDSISILAVWASRTTKQHGYVRETHKALDYFEEFLRARPSVMIGDFNSNTVWDKLHPGRSHSDMVRRLAEIGLESIYHTTHGVEHGLETDSTFYFYRKPERGYHIDYAFASRELLNAAQIEILPGEEWLGMSDHVPVVVDLDLTRDVI